MHELVDKENEARRQPDGLVVSKTEVVQGDMLESDWYKEADLVYVSSVCFPKELQIGIREQCRQLKKGARIMVLKMFDGDVRDFLQVTACIKVQMTWGPQKVVVYERI